MARIPTSRRAFLPFVAVLVPALAAQWGCGTEREGPRRTAAIEVTSDDGRVLQLDAPASRIISLIPARTDVILALGAADRLIARTQFDTDARLADLPAIEQALTPSLEWLIEKQPDLVIAWPDRQQRTIVTRLVEMDVPVYASSIETLAELREGVREIGKLIGRERGADSLVAVLDSAIERTRAAVASLPQPSVLYLIGLDPPIAAGPNTFISELIGVAGGRNVMDDATALWPVISLEEILVRQPDVVFLAVSDTTDPRRLRQFRGLPGVRHLRAVAQDRVRLVDADLFNRPGPALPAALQILAAGIHPGLRH